MPVVFVHGVNVRKDMDEYQHGNNRRDGCLRKIIAPALGLKPQKLQIFNPYWGDLGVKFAWNMAVLPRPDEHPETFGSQAEALASVAELLVESPGLTGDLLVDARQNFPATVDLLYAAALAEAKTEQEAEELAQAYLVSSAYAETTTNPPWLAQASVDNFVDQLEYYASQADTGSVDEAFGGAGAVGKKLLKNGVSKIAKWFANAAADKASAVAVRLVREKVNAQLTRFFGDAFVYLDQRGTYEAPGAIVQKVLDTLHTARAARSSDDDKLVVIAHSFGGEIIYDILTHFDPALEIDHLVTVGSQVGLFEEMKLYRASDSNISKTSPIKRVPRPAGVKHWLNVYDTNDILSYKLAPVMEGVLDYFYDTKGHILSAHGSYFKKPEFYKRLAKRLKQG